MSEKTVSIIIPVYNVEEYLPQCLKSVCEQTYKYLEIIVVDDSSPDRAGTIADEFAANDKRIQVYHIQNRGAAGARNVGLEKCHGDYVLFVDSDDWLEPTMVQKLVSAIEETDSDIALCQYWDEYINCSNRHNFMECSGMQTTEEFVRGMIQHWEYIITWNKLFRTTVLEGIRFVEGRCIDDEFFTYKTVIKSRKTVLVTDYLYHYRMRKSSAMRNPLHRKQRAKDQIAFITERYSPLCTAFPAVRSQLLRHKTEVLLTVIRNNPDFPDIIRDAKKALLKEVICVFTDSHIDNGLKKSIIVYLFFNPIAPVAQAITDTNQDSLFYR